MVALTGRPGIQPDTSNTSGFALLDAHANVQAMQEYPGIDDTNNWTMPTTLLEMVRIDAGGNAVLAPTPRVRHIEPPARALLDGHVVMRALPLDNHVLLLEGDQDPVNATNVRR